MLVAKTVEFFDLALCLVGTVARFCGTTQPGSLPKLLEEEEVDVQLRGVEKYCMQVSGLL